MRLRPSPAAHCLVCFTCQDKQSNWDCLKPTICSDTDSYCVTVSASAGLSECGCWAARLPVPTVALGSLGPVQCVVSVPHAGCPDGLVESQLTSTLGPR